MSNETLWGAAAWLIGLGVAAWITSRRRHPSRPHWWACLILLGLVIGAAAASLLLTAAVFYAAGLGEKAAGPVGPAIVVVSAVLAWGYGTRLIRGEPNRMGRSAGLG